MSNTSAKARLTQLREWLPTLKSHRDKHDERDYTNYDILFPYYLK